MRHYIIYDPATGEILLRIKSNSRVLPNDNCLEIFKEDYEGPMPVELVMRINLRTKKLERK